MKIKVLFLSQQRLLRETFATVFADLPDITFLPSVSNTEQAVDSIRLFLPDVILLDLNPGLFGIRVARDLQEACPSCRILVIASHADPIAETQLAIAGVKGVLSKDIGVKDLLWAIRQTNSGGSVFSQNGAAICRELPRPERCHGLSLREAQVLELVAKGLANKQIAGELGISIKTVEKHRQRVMCKLHAHETAGLTWRAICMGVGSRPVLATNGA